MATTFARMFQRRATTAEWESDNPVLADSELGWDSDVKQFKAGDGVTQWVDLPWLVGDIDVSTLPGTGNVASGTDSHAEGTETTASGDSAHASGEGSVAQGVGATAEGYQTQALNGYDHAEGSLTVASGNASHAEGTSTQALGLGSHAEGYNATAAADYSHAEGQATEASGPSSHAEGYGPVAEGEASHAEGRNTYAEGDYSHAEGEQSHAEGVGSHAEGTARASGLYSHAEGDSVASGSHSHAEGLAGASGDYSHAQGVSTVARAEASHSEGRYTNAFRPNEHAQGSAGAFAAADGIQHSDVYLAAADAGAGTSPILVPIHAGPCSVRVTILSGDGLLRWDLLVSATNDAVNYAGRGAGTVTINSQSGGGSAAHGTTIITWAVTGNSAGQLVITPSTSISDRRVWATLLELGSTYAAP